MLPLRPGDRKPAARKDEVKLGSLIPPTGMSEPGKPLLLRSGRREQSPVNPSGDTKDRGGEGAFRDILDLQLQAESGQSPVALSRSAGRRGGQGRVWQAK